MDGKSEGAKNKIAGLREREDSTREKECIRGVVFPCDRRWNNWHFHRLLKGGLTHRGERGVWVILLETRSDWRSIIYRALSRIRNHCLKRQGCKTVFKASPFQKCQPSEEANSCFTAVAHGNGSYAITCRQYRFSTCHFISSASCVFLLSRSQEESRGLEWDERKRP